MTPAKCPNPSCPFLFDPTQVPPGAVIACPRCGLRFTLGPSAPPPAYGPFAPTAPPPPAHDLGALEDRPNLDDMPTEERPRTRRRDETDPRARLQRPRAGSGVGKTIVLSVGAVLLICGALAGVLYWKSLTRRDGEQRATSGGKEVLQTNYNIAYRPPAGNWTADDKLKQDFDGPILAMSSQDPVGWTVLDAKSMAYTPLDAELHDMVRAVLSRNFGDLKDRLDEEPATLGGVPGKRYLFESFFKRGNEDVKGEVYAVGYQNKAYFVYSFAPEKKVDDIAQTFIDFRSHIRFTAAAKPTDQAGYKKDFRTQKGQYVLTATEKLWREAGDPSTQDLAADLWLSGKITIVGGGIRPDPADVVVLVLPANTNKAGVEAYLWKSVLFDRVDNPPQVKGITGEYEGTDPPAGPPDPKTPVSRYEIRYENAGSDSRKFVAVSMLDTGKNVIVAVGTSVLKQRKSWEKRLVQIVGSLAPLK